MEAGFKQGITACGKALASTQSTCLPRRFLTALEDLSKDQTRIVTQADKGGGVIVMDSSDYQQKMNELLADQSTYKPQVKGFCQTASLCFNTAARQILSASEEGKRMMYLLEEAPRTPRMRGLPKVHKPGIPMRPITSGIGSAPHRLAKKLAAPLSKSLGSISGCHIVNSGDLLRKIKNIGPRNKQLASFDVKSLFTSVPVEEALQAVTKKAKQLTSDELPLPIEDYLKLVTLCAHFGAFCFNDQEYQQCSGLAMGSPLSPVMACLFMEVLEQEHYKTICGSATTWYRYVDDILIIAPRRANIQDMLSRINSVHPKIQFTVEQESDEGVLPFLDIEIQRRNEGFLFKVYRKPTNKNDFLHFLSAHDEHTKAGVVIGFFLRALRVCSKCYLDAEYSYIKQAFRSMGYPAGWLESLQRKAVQIHQRPKLIREDEPSRITLPNSPAAQVITRTLSRGTNLQIALSAGTRTIDLVRRQTKATTPSQSVVYRIPCSGCPAAYIGETARGLKTRLREHRADMTYHKTSNAMVVHADSTGHLPKWTEAEVLHEGPSRVERKALEAARITTSNTINTRPGSFQWAPTAARLVLHATK